MEFYQKLKEVVMASDMTTVDKAYACTALNDIATYASSEDFARFSNGGLAGFNGMELDDKQGALSFLSAVGGLAKYEYGRGGTIGLLDSQFTIENADVVHKCFEKNGLITDNIVDEAVASLFGFFALNRIRTSVSDKRLSDIELAIAEAKAFAEQEIIWRYCRAKLSKVSTLEETKLLDIDKDLFLDMFNENARTDAFIRSIFRSMSDEQLKSVHDYLS